MQKGLYFIILVFVSSFINSQDLGLIQFDGLPNSIINPAFNSNHKILIGLGSRQFHFGNSGFTLDEGFEDGPNGKVLRLDNVINQVEDRNLLRYNEGLKTLEIAYKIKNAIIYFGHEWKLNAGLNYSNDLVEIAAFGNEPFIGRTADLSSDVLYNSYNQTAIGISSGNDKFRYGFRFKILNGVQNLYTSRNKLELATSDDIYQLSLDADYELYSSSLLDYQDIDDYEFNTMRFSMDHLYSSNWGYGIDLGLSSRVGKAELFMSAIDIGRISWNEDANRYYKKGISTYEGIDIQEFIGNDADYSVEDSLKSILSINREGKNYSSATNGSIFIGGKYLLDDKYTFGIVMRREFLIIDNPYSILINAQRSIGSFTKLGLSATFKDKSIANIGGHISFQYGPVLVYAITHNVLGGILPEKFRSASIRFGANLRLFQENIEE